MTVEPLVVDPTAWAEQTFAAIDLRDRRRERRAQTIATALLRHPDASLPQQLPTPGALKATYRLLAEADVTHTALCQPHWETTRAQAAQHDPVLLVQDTSEIDYSHHPSTTDLGPIGNGRGRGYLLQTVLAVTPQPRQVLGIAAQEPFRRQAAPKGQSCAQRRSRTRESQVWIRMVEAIGAPPDDQTWVHVGDRYSDIFDFLDACRQQHCQFLVRVAQDRRILEPDGTVQSLLHAIRTLPAQEQRPLEVPARAGQPARTAQLSISFRAATVRPPAHSRSKPVLPVWLVRVWEADPPDGTEPLEWILMTSVPTTTVADAWERVAWYQQRWLVEDYHQCLKTGCRIEHRHLRSYAGLMRLLGFLALVAVWLLQLREWARLEPERLATEVLPRDLVRVVAALAEIPLTSVTLNTFWRTVARQGGHQGRAGDGQPGWKTLWRGWLEIQRLLEGVHLAKRLPP